MLWWRADENGRGKKAGWKLDAKKQEMWDEGREVGVDNNVHLFVESLTKVKENTSTGEDDVPSQRRNRWRSGAGCMRKRWGTTKELFGTMILRARTKIKP